MTRRFNYSEKAKQVYPQEAQANHLSGLAKIQLKKFDQAVADFTAYRKQAARESEHHFLQRVCLRRHGQQTEISRGLLPYLQQVTEGEQAQYAYQRLVEWGVVKQSAQ